MKLNSFKTSADLKFMIILQNLITINHRKSDKSKYDRDKLMELDAVRVITQVQYYVNGIIYTLDYLLRRPFGAGGGESNLQALNIGNQ